MEVWTLAALALLVAVLYSSVGHGGASGYLAAMSLAGMTSATMKPTALVLNLLVAGLGSLRYLREGCFRWSVFWPFALGSIPFALLGGASQATEDWYRRILGSVLLVAALGLLVRRGEDREPKKMWILPAVGLGIAIGYLSGLIGVGGGIFLSPLLILSGLATTRETLGISSLFILVNSAAGLLGHVSSLQNLPSATWALAPAAFFGGLVGTELGARKLAPQWVRYLLCAVLLIAAAKLLFT